MSEKTTITFQCVFICFNDTSDHSEWVIQAIQTPVDVHFQCDPKGFPRSQRDVYHFPDGLGALKGTKAAPVCLAHNLLCFLQEAKDVIWETMIWVCRLMNKSIIAHIITKRAHVEAKNVWRPHKQRLPLASLQNSTLHCPSYRHSYPCILDLALRLPFSSGCTPRSVQSFLPGHHWQFWLGSNHQAPRWAAKMLQVEMQGSVSSSQGRLRQTESWKINLS